MKCAPTRPPIIGPVSPACCKHTRLFHVCTHALCVLHLLCVYVDAPGCRSAPAHFTCSFSHRFLVISEIFPLYPVCPGAPRSLWLIRGSPGSDSHPPTTTTFLYLCSISTPQLNPPTHKCDFLLTRDFFFLRTCALSHPSLTVVTVPLVPRSVPLGVPAP